MILANATSPETTGTGLVLVPVGSLEQHGPHLPLDTDTVIATAVANKVAKRIPGAWVAPPIAYGSSGEHQDFPGTCSIGSVVLRCVVIELVRSMRTWANRVVLINAHGGNTIALQAAVQELIDEGHDVAWVPCTAEKVDLHAGMAETSMMLHLRPASVQMDRVERGNMAPITELLPILMTHGMVAVTANGILGDPTDATAEYGLVVLEKMVEKVLGKLA